MSKGPSRRSPGAGSAPVNTIHDSPPTREPVPEFTFDVADPHDRAWRCNTGERVVRRGDAVCDSGGQFLGMVPADILDDMEPYCQARWLFSGNVVTVDRPTSLLRVCLRGTLGEL